MALRLIHPHSIIVVEVEDETGEQVRWQVELGSLRQLVRNQRWNQGTLMPGDRITIIGRRLKSGAPFMNIGEKARIVMTETGEELYRSRDYVDPDQ